MNTAPLPRFGLRTLFLLLFLAALGLWGYRWLTRESRAVAALLDQGALVYTCNTQGDIYLPGPNFPDAQAQRKLGLKLSVRLPPESSPREVGMLADLDRLIRVAASRRTWTPEDAAVLGRCRGLTAIEAFAAKGARALLRETQHLPELRVLLLNDSDLCEADLEYLNPRLTQLSLSGPGLGDSGLASIARLKALRSLYLNGDGVFTDAGVVELGKCIGLANLTLGESSQLTDQGMAAFRSFASLRRLAVSSPHFTDAGLLQLKEVFALEQLSVSGEQITWEGRNAFQEARGGYIDISLDFDSLDFD